MEICSRQIRETYCMLIGGIRGRYIVEMCGS